MIQSRLLGSPKYMIMIRRRTDQSKTFMVPKIECTSGASDAYVVPWISHVSGEIAYHNTKRKKRKNSSKKVTGKNT